MTGKRSNLVNVGRVMGVFGVQGWLKIQSSTEDEASILEYSPWWLKTRHGVKPFEIDEFKFRNKGLLVHFKGVDDRDTAAGYVHADIAIERAQLPELEVGEFYWHQLIGLTVTSEFDGGSHCLGVVKSILETGANDVLVVKPSADSLDDRERLVPYIPESYVKSVDLDAGCVVVEWDPEF